MWYSSSTKVFFLLCSTVVVWAADSSPALAQARSLRLHWSESGDSFWFSARSQDGKREFYLVEPQQRSVRLAFDHHRLAKLLSEKLDRKIDANDLPVSDIRLLDENNLILLDDAGNGWVLDTERYNLEANSGSGNVRSSLYLPPRPSRSSDVRTDLTVANQLDEAIELQWLSSRGETRSYGSVEAGAEKELSTFIGHTWLFLTPSGKLLGAFDATRNGRVVLSNEAVNAVSNRAADNSGRRDTRARSGRSWGNADSPDGQWTVFIRDHALWLKSQFADNSPETPAGNHRNEIQLASDADQRNSFLRQSRRGDNAGGGNPNVRWSPDSQYLIAYQTAAVDVRQVHYIESSPEGQLQPELRNYAYPKPGDPLARHTLRLFRVATAEEISVSNELFSDPYDVRFLSWSDNGDRFWLLYNQRGHQILRLLEVTVADGNVRTLAEETSDTFIQYSDPGKNFQEFLPTEELLWASERSGWNHLYRIDQRTGETINAVTAGAWNVKRVVKVDTVKQRIWFYAVGVVAEQDPYHQHFCRVNLDGSDFRVLTEGDGTHEIQFEQNEKFFVDTWSRVDLAPVAELRDSESGELICELHRQNATSQFRGRRLTERFHAPGRDGQTEIWGIIHFPKDFDSSKKYPVVENIYAGPHDHHVPKSFRSRFGHQHALADAGMIVVQIDGMGTAWRSKAFHDVCYKNLKDAGFPDRIAWMKAAAEQVPQMDLSRAGIYGGSAGGQNAMAALLWHHDFYKVAVADCGCHDNRMDKMWWNEQWMGYPVDQSYIENSNMENAHLMQGNLMLMVGELDNNVDPASTTQVVNKLIEANKDFEFVLVTGAGHGSAETPWGSMKRLNFLKRHLLEQ